MTNIMEISTRISLGTASNIKYSRNVKVVVIGSKEVGKTCVVKRFYEKKFTEKYSPTVGVDYGVIRIGDRDGINLNAHFFDLSGYSLFYEVRNEICHEADGVIVMFDISNHKSFLNLSIWLDEVTALVGGIENLQKKAVVLCGNKCDKPRKVSNSYGQMLADVYGLPYFETSALTGSGVSEMFEALFSLILTVQEFGYHPSLSCSSVRYTKEQLFAVCQLRMAQDDHEKLGLRAGATKEDVNRVYRRLAVLLHPDKCEIPGSEEAFKMLVAARAVLLYRIKH